MILSGGVLRNWDHCAGKRVLTWAAHEISCIVSSYENAEVDCLRHGLEGKITLRPIRKPVKEHGILTGLAMQSHDFFLAQTVNQ